MKEVSDAEAAIEEALAKLDIDYIRPLMNDFLRKMAKFYPWQISIGLRCQRWNKDQILYS